MDIEKIRKAILDACVFVPADIEEQLMQAEKSLALLSASPGERDGVITQRELEHALNCLSVDAAMNTPDFELAEKLFERAKAFKDYEADMAKIGYI